MWGTAVWRYARKRTRGPVRLKKWMGPAGRHDASSPQSSIRRSWTRSLGSQHAARPEGPQLTRSSAKPTATHPAASEENTVRTMFFIKRDVLAFESELQKIVLERRSRGFLWRALARLGCNTLYHMFVHTVKEVRTSRQTKDKSALYLLQVKPVRFRGQF